MSSKYNHGKLIQINDFPPLMYPQYRFKSIAVSQPDWSSHLAIFHKIYTHPKKTPRKSLISKIDFTTRFATICEQDGLHAQI